MSLNIHKCNFEIKQSFQFCGDCDCILGLNSVQKRELWACFITISTHSQAFPGSVVHPRLSAMALVTPRLRPRHGH